MRVTLIITNLSWWIPGFWGPYINTFWDRYADFKMFHICALNLTSKKATHIQDTITASSISKVPIVLQSQPTLQWKEEGEYKCTVRHETAEKLLNVVDLRWVSKNDCDFFCELSTSDLTCQNTSQISINKFSYNGKGCFYIYYYLESNSSSLDI